MSHVGETLERLAARHSSRAALSDGRRTLSRSDLLELVRSSQTFLEREAAAERVLVPTGDAIEALCRILAVARSSRAAVVVDPAHLDRHGDRLRGSLVSLFAAWDETPSDGEAPSGTARPLSGRPGPETPFYIGLTSGSTGQPKAFQRSHRSWTESFRLADEAFGLGPDEHVLVPGGLGHSLHLFGAIHGLHRGWRVDVVRSFQPLSVLRRMQEARSTVLVTTPTQLRLLAIAGDREELRFGALRRILISGAKWHARDRELVARVFPQAECHEFYGTSETSFISHRGAADSCSDGVGRSFPGVELEVRGSDGNALPAGEEGEIWVRSPLLFDRYVMGDEPMTRTKAGWLTVGDRGHLDAEGRIFLAGRGGRMIVTSGLNVFAEEIETVLLEYPGIAQAAVFGVPDTLRGARIVAAVQLADPALAPADLRRHCLARLERAKVPRSFHVAEHWPLTPGGKPDLQTIAAWVLEQEEADAGVSDRSKA
ncbi:AMP-binding protein [Stappia indica]|uniref:Long-chain acyl-CoA synthetase n=1 Tax=Stappia indica TaxID=538381 RepID=A0A285TNC8_9HYPH|nr:AMP-binding protein [Stappia indica]SOC22066.1 long-chain acyl-CoA synthetase [Stappia indica]